MTHGEEMDEERFLQVAGVGDDQVLAIKERYNYGEYALALYRLFWEGGKAYGLELRGCCGESGNTLDLSR